MANEPRQPPRWSDAPRSSRRAWVGLPVTDRSSDLIGVVIEVFGAIFRVQVDQSASFWLGSDIVEKVSVGERVSLRINADELDQHKHQTDSPSRAPAKD